MIYLSAYFFFALQFILVAIISPFFYPSFNHIEAAKTGTLLILRILISFILTSFVLFLFINPNPGIDNNLARFALHPIALTVDFVGILVLLFYGVQSLRYRVWKTPFLKEVMWIAVKPLVITVVMIIILKLAILSVFGFIIGSK